MIKRLKDWLPLVKDLVALWAPYHQRDGNIFLIQCKVYCKNISHIKLDFIRMGLYFFLSMAKQTKGKIIADIIKKDEST